MHSHKHINTDILTHAYTHRFACTYTNTRVYMHTHVYVGVWSLRFLIRRRYTNAYRLSAYSSIIFCSFEFCKISITAISRIRKCAARNWYAICHTRIYIHVYTYIYVHVYIYIYVHVYMYIYVHLYMYIYVHLYMYIYAHM